MAQVEEESQVDILELSSEALHVNLIRPLHENAEALKIICNLLENETFIYNLEECPSCREKNCEHVKGFNLAKKSFLWNKSGNLIDKEASKEMERQFQK